VLKVLSATAIDIAPPPPSDQDVVEETPGIAPSASPDIALPVSAAGQQQHRHHHEEDVVMVPVDSSHILTILSSNTPFRSLLRSLLRSHSTRNFLHPVPLK
jgi:hypothetical protein